MDGEQLLHVRSVRKHVGEQVEDFVDFEGRKDAVASQLDGELFFVVADEELKVAFYVAVESGLEVDLEEDALMTGH